MALTLSASNPNQSGTTRPATPRDCNGIAHATRSGGTGAQTKADRVITKLAWAHFVQDWKLGTSDSSAPSEFPESGSGITYSGD